MASRTDVIERLTGYLKLAKIRVEPMRDANSLRCGDVWIYARTGRFSRDDTCAHVVVRSNYLYGRVSRNSGGMSSTRTFPAKKDGTFNFAGIADAVRLFNTAAKEGEARDKKRAKELVEAEGQYKKLRARLCKQLKVNGDGYGDVRCGPVTLKLHSDGKSVDVTIPRLKPEVAIEIAQRYRGIVS